MKFNNDRDYKPYNKREKFGGTRDDRRIFMAELNSKLSSRISSNCFFQQ